jgi:hypothetical protein
VKLVDLTWAQVRRMVWLCGSCIGAIVRIPGMFCGPCLEGLWLAQSFERAEQEKKERDHVGFH